MTQAVSLNRDATLKKAEKFLRQGKLDDAIAEYVRLIDEQPRDWSSINTLGDLYARAGSPERAIEQYTRVADFLFDEGFLPKAQAVYKKTLRVQAGDDHTLSRLADVATQLKVFVDARTYLRQLQEHRSSRGDANGAAECIVRLGMLDDADPNARVAAARAASQLGNSALADSLLSDPELVIAVAEDELAAGEDTAAQARLTRLIAQSPARTADVVRLALKLSREGHADRAFACVDIAVDAALLDGEMSRAVEILRQFVSASPHIPALSKLVETCVDAGLETEMREAQRLLAEAYRAAGRDAEARVITEDLEGGDDLGADFFDLSSKDLSIEPDPMPTEIAPEIALEEDAPVLSDLADETIVIESVEIDLSDALGQLEATPVLPRPAAIAAIEEPVVPEEPPAVEEPPPDIEDIFRGLRAKADRDLETMDAAERFETALQDITAGNRDDAVEALHNVVKVPAYRFRAGAELGRLYLAAGNHMKAIEWFERAAEAPPIDAAAGVALLYDLAEALERSGETARSLAVLLELQADMPTYRDVAARIDRLTREQAGTPRR